MNNYIKFTTLIILAVVLQTSILPHYIIAAYKPDLLLVIMVYLALRTPANHTVFSAYLLGLLKDVLGGIYLGLNGFSFVLFCLLLKAVSDRLYVQSSILYVLTVGAATAITTIINLLLLIIFSQGENLITAAATLLLPHLLMNMFIASIVTAMPRYFAPLDSK
ncbi:MAG: rod shape-determining protein MreD [Trichlorobacter sp.]|nr:rod shape-determining protein MreD [Trichlorobacter sp.]